MRDFGQKNCLKQQQHLVFPIMWRHQSSISIYQMLLILLFLLDRSRQMDQLRDKVVIGLNNAQHDAVF